MADLEDKDVATFSKFKGLRNTVGPESFDLGDLATATNVDITDELRVQRRRGYASFSAGSYHSLFASGTVMLAVTGTTLVRFSPGGASAVIRSGLTSGRRMAYAAVGARIYYSNGSETGCVDAGENRTWGITPPAVQPVAADTGGLLRPGTYQYAVTFVRSDGQESGTGAAGQVDVVSGGIAFSGIPVSSDPDVDSRRLYVSPPDGEMLFLVGTLDATSTTATYDIPVDGTLPLATQFKQQAPAGAVLGYFAGHILVGLGSRLYISEPYAHELFDLRRGYRFSAPITMIAPVGDGVYLGTEAEIAFLAGKDVTKLVYQQRANYGAIEGTLATSLAEDFEPGAQGSAVVFGTMQGICVGLNSGVLKNLTAERFNYPTTRRGAGVVRNYGGAVQYLMVLEGTETAGNTAF